MTEGKLNILMVDDVPANLLALEAMLEDLGENLVRASSGNEALRLLLRQEFALILLDVEMPDMDGFETATFIRARQQTRDTPIIFLTAAQRSVEQVFRGYSLGAVDYLLKPLQPEILRWKVAVFVELARKNRLVKVQAEELRSKNVELQTARLRAEEESRAKSSFLAGMSHELRTPLNAIIGFSDLLVQDAAGELNERQREFVTHVLDSGRHLLSLINDVLDLSKVQAGRMDLRPELLHLGPLVEGVRGGLVPLAERQGVELSIDVPGDLPPLSADPVRLKQVFYNLLSNGLKFTPRGGRVSLTAREETPWLRIDVSDTGIGISAEDMPRLFKEFEQITPAQGTKPEGTGLGLALTRRLLALHGGKIDVTSRPQEGSTFTVHLPLAVEGDDPRDRGNGNGKGKGAADGSGSGLEAGE
jgi:signal transduction histidine kinase